jgi:GT2 family glycosyltransferase
MDRPDLSVVIVSWNTRDLLRDCLASVFAEPSGLKLEVFVADNASSDGSAQMVRDSFSKVRLIENEKNLGFAAANNAVFPLCQSDKILLLNPDTVVKADALRVLSAFLDRHAEAGAVAPKLAQTEADVDILGCGNLLTLETSINHWLFLARWFPRIFDGIYYYAGVHDDKTREVGWVSGACMLVRRAVIDQVGPLHERWFMYAEDHEWCARMKQAGWRIFHVPAAVVEHRHGASFQQNEAISLSPITAERELFIHLNHPSRLELLIYDLTRTIGFGLRATGYFLRGIVGVASWRSARIDKAKIFLAYTKAALRSLASP